MKLKINNNKILKKIMKMFSYDIKKIESVKWMRIRLRICMNKEGMS